MPTILRTSAFILHEAGHQLQVQLGILVAGLHQQQQTFKAIPNMASPTWRRPTSLSCLWPLRFLISTKWVHPAAPTKHVGNLQKRIPTFIFIHVTDSVAGIRWIEHYLLNPAEIQ